MRVYALELDNGLKGFAERKAYIEGLFRSWRCVRDIPFHRQDILPGNRLFRQFILKPGTEAGIRIYEENRGKERIVWFCPIRPFCGCWRRKAW